MLISHHAPSDRCRTVGVGSIRICTRCLGVLIGILIFIYAGFSGMPYPRIVAVWAPFVLPVPAALDFLNHELRRRASNTFKRISTGFMLGISISIMGQNCYSGDWLLGPAQLTMLFTIEFAVALVLKLSGRLEEYVARYENAVRYEPEKNNDINRMINRIK